MQHQPVAVESTEAIPAAPFAEVSDAESEMPMECPLSHRVARRVSTMIIVALCVLIAAAACYALTTGS